MTKNSAVPDLSKLQPLIGSNYRRWSEELMFFFQERGLDYVLVDDKSATSTTPSTESTQGDDTQSSKTRPVGTLEDHNRTCRGHIIRHLSEKLFDIYVNCDSAKEIWINLKKRYGAEDEGKKQYVTSKWTSFQMKDDQPVQTNFMSMKRSSKHCEICAAVKEWTDPVMLLLQNSPNMKSLKLSYARPDGFPLSWKKPSCVPECLSSQLEIFEWKKYGSTQEEEDFLTYILANSKCLKIAFISLELRDFNLWDAIKKDVQDIPRVSTESQLSFFDTET